MDGSASQVFEANSKRDQLWTALAIGIVCVLIGLITARVGLDHVEEPGLLMSVALWGALVFLMIGISVAAAALRRLMAPKPLLRISRDGILDRNIAPETIPWHAIEEIYRSDSFGQHLMLRLDAERARRLAIHRGQASLAGPDGAAVAPGHALSVKGIDQPFDAIVAAIERYRTVTVAAPADDAADTDP